LWDINGRRPMNHERYFEFVNLYVDNELDDKTSAELFAHLGACETCREFMRTTMRVRSHIASQELAEVPLALDRRVLASMRREVTTVRERGRWFKPVWFTRISIPLPAAASIIFLVIVGSLLFSPLLLREERPPQQVNVEQVMPIPPELQEQLLPYR
jgi:anti-sigma factor RsiW